MKKWFAALLAAGLCVMGAASALADIVFEPVGDYGFSLGLDCNYEKDFTTTTRLRSDYAAMEGQCTCGAEEHSIRVIEKPSFKPLGECPYEISEEFIQQGIIRRGIFKYEFNIVCSAQEGTVVEEGFYPFRLAMTFQCGDNPPAVAECVIPLTVGDGSQNLRWGGTLEDIIGKIGYSPDVVYARDAEGQVVRFIQDALRELGYYKGALSDYFNAGTESAVKEFQRGYDLPVTGKCGEKTMTRLFNAYLGRVETVYEKEYADMRWLDAKDWLRSGAVVKLIDLKTDLSMNVKIRKLDGHIDVEPLTAADTRLLCRMYGVSDAQDILSLMDNELYHKRPMLLSVSNGRQNVQIVCSLDVMLGAAYDIADNEFDGHICLYLRGSSMHGRSLSGIEQENQAVIDEAMRLMETKAGTIGFGHIVGSRNAMENVPQLETPVLVMPGGKAQDMSSLLKYGLPEVTADNTITYDMQRASLEGEALTLPEGCLLYFPYPEGLDETSILDYEVVIKHRISETETETFTSAQGDIVFTSQGLYIPVSSFSPFEISWGEGISADGLPKTGDDSLPLSFLFAAMMTSLCGAALLGKRRIN